MSAASCLASVSPRAIDAVVRRTPITGDTERVSMPEGSTLGDIVRVAFPNPEHRGFAVVLLNGEEIPLAMWDIVPKAGDTVALAFRPAGKDFFRTLLQIAVIAVAVWISGGGLGGVFAAGSWQAAVAAAGVTILGNLAINALIPIKPPTAPDAPPPYYSLSGARNSARPFDTVPMLFGTHRIVPPRMSEPVQEVIGGLTYLRFALCLGLCPMEVSDWKIGETALSSYSNVEMELRLNADDPEHTLLTGDPSQEGVGATLNHTEWVTRTTVADTDEIEVILDFPSGLGGVDSKNRKTQRAAGFYVEYRPTGSDEPWLTRRPNVPTANQATNNLGVPWRPSYLSLFSNLIDYGDELNNVGAPGGAWSITRADPGRGFRAVQRWAVPRGQYDVRVMRTSAASTDSNVLDAAVWSVLSSIKTQVDPFPNRKLATAVFRIKATDQLTGMVDTVNCIASSLQPVFSAEALADPAIADAGEFTDVEASSNPAHLALLAARGPNTAFPKPDAEIDWPAWADAAAWFEAQGLTFNEYVEGKIGRWEMVSRILAAGHARPVKHNGRLSVVVDRSRADEAPAQVFSPRNVRNFRWRKTYPRLPHALRVAFANAANNWQADEVTVYLPGQSAETATRFENLPMPGKTDEDEIRTVANQYARNAHFQTESFEFETDAEHLASKRGDFVVIQHFAMATGIGAGRVVAREVNGGGDVTAVILDTPLDTPESGALALQWRAVVVESGAARMEVMDEKPVTRDAENPRRFVFVTPLAPAAAPAIPAGDYEGDVALVGLAGKVSIEALIADIEPRAHLQAAIRCVAYAGERFVDAPDWPAHNPRVTLPYAPRPTAPVAGTPAPRSLEIAVPFTQPEMPHGVRLTGYVIAWREHGEADDTWEPLGGLGPDERIAITPPGDPGASYDVRIVAIGMREDGVTVYSDALVVEEIAAATTPVAPDTCAASFSERTSAGGAKQLVLVATWAPNEDPGVLDTVVEQLVSTGPDVWRELGRGRAASGRTEIHGVPVGRNYDLGFVNLSRRGAPSTRTAIATITAPDTLVATGALDAVPGSALADAIAAAATSSDAAAAAALAAQAAAEAAFAAAADEAAAALASASAAAASQTAAAGSASAAAGSATSASSSQMAAAGSASAAAASASAAAASATAASGSASAASTSASSAATQATNASNSASAAQTSAVSAQSVANRIIPQRLSVEADFGGVTSNGDPSAVAAPNFTASSVVSVTNKGNVRRFTGTCTCSSRGWLPVIAGHTYRAQMEIQCTSAGASGNQSRVVMRVYAADGTYLGAAGQTVRATVSTFGWEIVTFETTATAILASYPTAAFVRASANFNENGTPGVTEGSLLSLSDITAEAAAAGSASAAATSASSAATSQSAAASSASAASTSATNAATQAGNASTSATNASSSATTAAGHASSASTSATTAAASQSAAAGSASAAATSASTASTQASNASSSASAASASATLAANYYSDRLNSGGANRPAIANDFAETTGGGTPSSLSAISSGTVVTAANEGSVRKFADLRTFTTRKWLPVIAGHTYRMTHRTRVTADGTDNRLVAAFISMDSAGTFLATLDFHQADTAHVAADGWQTFTRDITAATILAAQSTCAWIRPRLSVNRNNAGTDSGADTEVAILDIEDVTTLLATNASIATNASAIATETTARAAADTTLTASLGTTNANVSTNASAIATINGAAAFFELVVAASGGDLSAVRLKAGASGSFLELVSTVLRLANVSNGAVIEIMRATGGEAYFSRPISSDGGGKRVTIGPGYGVSGEEVVLWFGPDTVAPSAQSRTNGYFALGTDGKTYVGASELLPTVPPAIAANDVVEINSTTDQELCSAVVGPTATGDRIRVGVFLSSEEEAAGGTGMIWSVYFGTTLLATGALTITSAGEIVFTDDPADALRGSFPAAHAGPDTVYLYLRKTNSGHDDRNVSGELFVEVMRTDYSVLLP